MENSLTKVEERWKPIIHFPKYQISNSGRVKSFWGIQSRILKAVPDREDGYALVTLCNEDGQFNKRIHELVLSQFSGNRPKNSVCNHQDFNKMNNSVSNLEWTTQAKNVQHAYQENRANGPSGERNGQSKLKKDEVLLIKQLCKSKIKRYLVARMFMVSQATISMIANNQRWRQI